MMLDPKTHGKRFHFWRSILPFWLRYAPMRETHRSSVQRYDRRSQTVRFCVKAAWAVGFEGARRDYKESRRLLLECHRRNKNDSWLYVPGVPDLNRIANFV